MADDLMMMLRGLQASARRAPRLYRDLGHLTLHTRRMCIVAGRKWFNEYGSSSARRSNQQRVFTRAVTRELPTIENLWKIRASGVIACKFC